MLTRTLVLLGILFILVGMGVAMWVRASADLGDAVTSCAMGMQLAERLGQVKEYDQIQLLLAETIDCVDQRKSFLAGLLFDRDEAMEKLEAQFRASAELHREEFRQMREIEQEIQNQESDYEGQRNLDEFRRGVYQGNP